MNRVTSLAALRRAATATTASISHTRPLRRLAPFSSSAYSHWFSGRHSDASSPVSHSLPSNNIAGTVFFSVAAAVSLSQEAHAKAPLQSHNFKDVVLYQFEACPFCNKVKAFLDYYNIPYKVVEVHPLSKKELKWSDYKKVPILTVDGEQMVESSAIIESLFEKMHPEGSAISSTLTEEEKKWLGWVDTHLVHVLSPNIYRTVGEALETSDYITTQGNFSLMERIMGKYGGAVAMYFVSKKLKKKHNITGERESLYQSAETWVDALNGRSFLGGSSPNLADLAVYGVLRPIRYLQSGKDMVEHTRVGDWYSRMEKMVGQSSRITA